jgi:hypothetical protein
LTTRQRYVPTRLSGEAGCSLTERLAYASPNGQYALVAKPALRSGEREIATYRANRAQGSRSVGGHLLLTDQRVAFYPHKLDSSTGGLSWECEIETVTKVSVAPRGRNPFDGSMRRRLRIDCGDKSEYFVVNKVGTIVTAIEQAAGL